MPTKTRGRHRPGLRFLALISLLLVAAANGSVHRSVQTSGAQGIIFGTSAGPPAWAIIANYPGGTVNGFSSTCGSGSLNGGGGACAISIEGGSAGSPAEVTGNVWTAGPWLLTSPSTPKVQIAGNLYEQGPAVGSTASIGACNPPGGQGTMQNTKAIDVVTPGALEPCNTPSDGGPTCTGPCPAPVPPHALPSTIPSLVNPPSSTTTCSSPSPVVGTFTVLRPGHYTSVPSGFLSGQTYLQSGVYYFDNVGDLYVGGSSTNRGVLIGGQPAGGAVENPYILDPTSCPGLADPPGSGTGVELILGGNSSLHMEASTSQMELFARSPATPDGSTPGISIYQVQAADAAAGWAPSTFADIAPDRYPYPGTVSPDVVHVGAPETNNDSTENLMATIHGLIYAPVGNVELTAPTAVAFPVAPGGVDVYGLDAEEGGGTIPSATTTALVASQNPAAIGQQVTYTATVSPATGPTGTVSFRDGATPITCAAGSDETLNSSGQATCLVTYADTTGSPHQITANYGGDLSFNGSTSAAVSETVSPEASSTAVAADHNPVAAGQQVTYTASVTGPGPSPTGGVTFMDGVSTISCAAGSDQTLNGLGQATCLVTYPSTSGSPHQITAVYGGDAIYATSTSPVLAETVTSVEPSVITLSPASGPVAGGRTVTITGTNLSGATGVHFGTKLANILTDGATTMTVRTPAGAAGTVDVTVTTPQGTSARGSHDRYTYVARPTVTRVSPASGSHLGGTTVTITGTNLSAATAVHFGTKLATVVSDGPTSITVRAPAASIGTVAVTVTTAGGTSATSAADRFRYA